MKCLRLWSEVLLATRRALAHKAAWRGQAHRAASKKRSVRNLTRRSALQLDAMRLGRHEAIR